MIDKYLSQRVEIQPRCYNFSYLYITFSACGLCDSNSVSDKCQIM